MDFSGLNQAVLGQLETLLAEYLPGGRKVGHEWVCGDIQGNPGNSCKTSFITGKGADFGAAPDDGWTDLVQLVSKQKGIGMIAAAQEVAARIGYALNGNGHAANGHANPVPPSKTARKAPDKTPEPIPANAPTVPKHWDWGEPAASYVYEHYFVHCRYELADGSKQFTPWTWRQGKWSPKAWPDPKPIFGRELLEQRPDVAVLVVEGEKCALAARTLFPGLVVVTWSGGANQVLKQDWTVLKGRKVEIWPDADDPGRKAAAQLSGVLLKIGVDRLRVVDTTDLLEGWDVADAAAEDWDRETTQAWVRERLRPVEPPETPQKGPEKPKKTRKQPPAPEPNSEPANAIEIQPPSTFVSWQSLGLDTNEGGQPFATIANVSLIIQAHPELSNKIWMDTFRAQIYHTLHSEIAVPWTDSDTRDLVVWIQQRLKIPKVTPNMVHEGVMHAAQLRGRHSLRDALDALVWDGVRRREHWLADILGVPQSEYSAALGGNWLRGMVARANRPGCQVHTMPVLEGLMGRGKSMFLQLLGSPWFCALPIGFGDKDYQQAIQGIWLVEVPDMSAFNKRDHKNIIAFITNPADRYRASYGRITEDHPRVATFAATSENDNYLQSPDGRRRYFPLRCGNIDLDGFALMRDQLLAEAVHDFKQGATWWEFPVAATAAEQDQRLLLDPWHQSVERYVSNLTQVTTEELLSSESCVGYALQHQDHRDVLRMCAILRFLGWRPSVVKTRDRRSLRIWRPASPRLLDSP
jgi:predicted P-loop ATPase